MNATIMKGERSKLLAVVAIMAMVVCAFAVFAPATDVDAEVAETDVASIGDTGYATLQAAVDAAVDGDTIKLLKDASGSGIIIYEKNAKNITIDFQGFTYTIGGPAVGSPGYESQAFHFERGCTIVLKNGTITATNDSGVSMLMQNYCDLTYENMVLDASNNPNIGYVASNNNGYITIAGNTQILASEGKVAFDVCDFSSYEKVTVEIDETFTGKIDGKVEMTIDRSTVPSDVDLIINASVNLDNLDIKTGELTLDNGAVLSVDEEVTISNGKIIVNNGTVSNVTINLPGYAAVVTEQNLNGTVTFDGCTFNAPQNGTVAGVYIGMFSGMEANVNVTDCTFNGTYTEGAVDFNAQADSKVKVTVSGEKSVSVHAWAVNGDAVVEIGKNLDLSGATDVTELKMSGSTGNQPTIVVPEGQTLVVDKITGTGNIEDKGGDIVCEDVSVPVVNDKGEYHVTSYEGLVQAITNTGATVILDADIVATSYITSSVGNGVTVNLNKFDLTMGGHPINLAGITLKIPSGSEFSTDARVGYVGNIVTEPGARIALGDNARLYEAAGSDTPSEDAYKNTVNVYDVMVEGSILSITSGDWTIFKEEFVPQTGAHIFVTYGIAMDNPVYDGAPVVITDFHLSITLFSAIQDGKPAKGFTAALEFPLTSIKGNSQIIDAGTYYDRLAIAVELYDPTSETRDYSHNDVDIVIRQASSTITVSQPSENIEGQQTSIVITAEDGNEYAVTGNLIQVDGKYKLTLPVATDVTYYSLVDGEYVSTDIELIASMFTNATYADGVITIDLGESISAEYKFTVDFDTAEKKDNWTTETYTLDLSGVSVESIISIDETTLEQVYEVEVGDLQTGIAIDESNLVKGTVFYYDGTWEAGTWGTDMSKGYYVLYDINVPGDEDFWNAGVNDARIVFTHLDAENQTIRTITYDGSFDGYMLVFLGADGIDVAKTEILVDLDDEGTKYSQDKYTVNYELTTSAKVEFLPITDDNVNEVTGSDDLYGKTPSDLQTDLNIDGNLKVTGTVNWVSEYQQFNISVQTEQRGYYIAFYLQLPGSIASWDGVSISTSDGKSWDGTDKVFDGYFVYRVMDNGPITIIIDLGETYEPAEYTLDLTGLTYGTASGYLEEPEGTESTEDMTDVEGIMLGDVIDRTLYMIFNTQGVTGDYTMQLLRDGKVIYTDTDAMWDNLGNGSYIWYLSFDDQLKDLFENPADIGGLYTMQAVNGDYTVETEIAIAGTVGYGFEFDGTDAYEGIKGDNSGFTDTKIGDETMWIVWYNDIALSGDVTANLYFGDDLTTPIWHETDGDKWLQAGYRTWYFSFDDGQPARLAGLPALEYGTYTMVIMNGETELARGVVEVIDTDSWTVTFNEYRETYDDDDQYDITKVFATGDLYKLPGTNYSDKTLIGWDLYVKADGEWQFVRHYDENGAVHFGYIDFGDIVNPGQELEFRAHYDDSEMPASDLTVDIIDKGFANDSADAERMIYESWNGGVLNTIEDDTLFMIYDLNKDVTGLKGFLYDLKGTVIYTEKDALPGTAGEHIWYFSFADGQQAAGAITQSGTYRMVIEDADGNAVAFTYVYVTVQDDAEQTGGAITEYTIGLEVVDNTLVIDTKKAEDDTGSVNALAQFLYRVDVSKADGTVQSKIINSSLIYGGPINEIKVANELNITLASGDFVDVTLMTMSGDNEVFYGTWSIMVP